ncbi:MAG: PEP-CTERM sorting domain-containing protein [Planctomycetales bacterium]|nr:PEP-CTERM sorting domain-containing protein [Planctomycetales bacterium]
MKLMNRIVVGCVCILPLLIASQGRADLLGYWSADSTGGVGEVLPNDQGNGDLDGELVEASYTGDAGGHTGQPGDYAIEFEGFDEDYAAIPATEEVFSEITITAWVNGLPNGDWAGIVVSRNDPQPLYLGFYGGTTDLAYVWNDNSSETYGWQSETPIGEEEWTFVALTVQEDFAAVYAGIKGDDELVFNVNEIEHWEQENLGEWRLAEDNCCGANRNFAGLIDDVSIWNEALNEDQLTALFKGTETPLTLAGLANTVAGDFDNSGQRDVADLDLLADAMVSGDVAFDLNGDGNVNIADRIEWVENLSNTFMGDANFDGEFNSSDFVTVFTPAKYETGQAATWAEGDWNGDKEFDSSDFVTAFSGGGYESGPRNGGLQVVPEPSGIVLLLTGLFFLMRRHNR